VQSADLNSLFAQLVSHKASNTKLNAFVNKAQPTPEVLLAFIYPQLSSLQSSSLTGAYAIDPQPSFLKSMVSSSSNSLSIPYVLLEGTSSLSGTLVNSVSSASPKAQVLASEPEPSQKSGLSGCDALLNHIQEESRLFSNGVTDVVIVHYDHTKDNVHCMDRVVDYVNQHTHGKFVTLLSAETSSANPLQMVFSDGSESPHFESRPLSFAEFAVESRPGSKFQTSATTGYVPVVYVGVQYVTPNTMVALFLMFFMLFVIYIGATCVRDIETPVRFSSTPLQLSKEY